MSVSQVHSTLGPGPLVEAGCGSFDVGVLIGLTPSRHREDIGLCEAAGHGSRGGGAQSEVPGTARTDLGVSRPAKRPEPSGSQAPGHPRHSWMLWNC